MRNRSGMRDDHSSLYVASSPQNYGCVFVVSAPIEAAASHNSTSSHFFTRADPAPPPRDRGASDGARRGRSGGAVGERGAGGVAERARAVERLVQKRKGTRGARSGERGRREATRGGRARGGRGRRGATKGGEAERLGEGERKGTSSSSARLGCRAVAVSASVTDLPHVTKDPFVSRSHDPSRSMHFYHAAAPRP